MTDIKMLSTLEARKVVKVLFFELTKKGIVIDYVYNGIERTINANPVESARILKEAGLINNWEVNKAKLHLSWEEEYNTTDQNGYHQQQCKTVYGLWEQFVLETSFGQYDALCIAANHLKTMLTKMAVKKAQNQGREKVLA